MHNPSVAMLREGQRCRALGGRIPMHWVATFLRIAWQLCRGLGGNFPADWVAEFRGIRTRPVGVAEGRVSNDRHGGRPRRYDGAAPSPPPVSGNLVRWSHPHALDMGPLRPASS